MNTKAWKTIPPAQPGLFVASACRNASSLRYWTGSHWTAPTSVADLHLPGRMPDATWPAADLRGLGRVRTKWLEAVTVDADGFVSGAARSKAARSSVAFVSR